VGAIIILALTSFPAHANPFLDSVKQAIYIKNLSTAIKNTDWSQQLEKGTIRFIEEKTKQIKYERSVAKIQQN
jgi:hypothetical protein